MESLGESDLVIASNIVGKVRVLNIFSDSALFPRLGLAVGVTLHDRPDLSAGIEPTSLVNYEMRDAIGELRLSEHGDVVGAVVWASPHRHVRSLKYASESHIKLVCDLDHWRLEQIEQRRAGQAPRFWLEIWPMLMLKGQALDADIHPIDLRVSRESWLDFYTKSRGAEVDVLEIVYSRQEAESFRRALAKIREARAQIVKGDYDAAVALCRNVIEALGQELPPNEAEDPLRALFVRRTDERKAKEYSGIVSKLKQLAGFAHHEFGRPVVYSRAEAQFVVRVTEALLVLAGQLSQD